MRSLALVGFSKGVHDPQGDYKAWPAGKVSQEGQLEGFLALPLLLPSLLTGPVCTVLHRGVDGTSALNLLLHCLMT